jgi:hypothetical protein
MGTVALAREVFRSGRGYGAAGSLPPPGTPVLELGGVTIGSGGLVIRG